VEWAVSIDAEWTVGINADLTVGIDAEQTAGIEANWTVSINSDWMIGVPLPDFSLLHNVQTCLGSTNPPIQWVLGTDPFG
jgi:hypothetical protein